MKTFITKTLIFIFISTIVIGTLFLSILLVINKKSDFTLKKPVENIIFGHSHPSYAFNDTLIDNFKNLAQSRQSYLYTYIKIKNVISQNRSVNTIFLEFTNNQITEEMNDWLWDKMTITSRLPIYLPFLKKDEIKLLYHNNPKAFVPGLSKSFRENIINIATKKFDYTDRIGGYQWTKRNDVDSILASKNSQKTDSGKSIYKLSLSNIMYLEKIVDYCNNNNIKLYFIRSPQHKKYKGRLNEQLFLNIKNQKFRTIEFLDFNNFPVENTDFADLDHLNYKGASKFSRWFNKLTQKGLLKVKNKQQFLEKELSLLP
jgi:hypothetical protein